MVRSGLSNRVDALERTSCGVKRWHQIIREVGQTEEQAVADYEREHGSIGPDDGRLMVVIVEPVKAHEAA